VGIDIKFTQIQKSYHQTSLYLNLTGTISAGSCTAIIGNNGSGKSTFLKIIATLIRPSAGTVIYTENNYSLSLEEVRHQTAYISPEIQFYDALTAGENLAFFTGLSGISLTADKIKNILHMVNMSSASIVQVGNFSTGMKQRLKLALLYAVQKKIWLLDEPSSNLDEHGRELVKKLIDTAKREQRTVLLATNDPAEVSYADTVYCLS
jgi:heme exporter protein A